MFLIANEKFGSNSNRSRVGNHFRESAIQLRNDPRLSPGMMVGMPRKRKIRSLGISGRKEE